MRDGYLTAVHETHNIVKTCRRCSSRYRRRNIRAINPESYVSMNMWGLTPEFVDILEDGFIEFFETYCGDKDILKAEYLFADLY